MTNQGRRIEREHQAVIKDQRIWGGQNIPVARAEKPKRGAVQTAAKISGKQTTLGMLLDRAVARMITGDSEEE